MISRLSMVRYAFLVLAVGLTFGAGIASARPAHKRALADYLGPFLDKKLDDCLTCHLPIKPGDEEGERPHNPFGARLHAVRRELSKANKSTDLAARLDTIAQEDADGDGINNLLELLAGRFPGDKYDRASDAELTAVRQKLPDFAKFRSAYPWRPFEIVTRPAVPRVKNATWVRNPIDAFLAAQHEERKLATRPEATRLVLLRRLYFDLIGLPPTPDEIDAYLKDASPDAYEKVVDRLLQSPRYGERWGRHWMDVWRYSDVDGTGAQIFSQPHIWRWRDWIIESLNDDKPYDRMIVEMVAGDELAPDDPKTLAATGFIVRNHNKFYPQVLLQDMVEYTSQALLGVTLRCARCHDHMYDPITQKEYYQVAAIFKPVQIRIDHVPGEMDTTKAGLAHVFDGDLKAQVFLLEKGDLGRPGKVPIPPGVPASLGGTFPDISPIKLPASAYAPEKRDFVIKGLVAAREAAIKTARDKQSKADKGDLVAAAEVKVAEAELASLLATLEAEKLEDAGKKDSGDWKKAAAVAFTAQKRQALEEARKNLVVARKDLADPKKKDAAAKKVEAAEKALAKAETDSKAPPALTYAKRVSKTYPQESTGRRLAFARWLAARDNPLAARVAVNHMWMRHFGQPIVARVYDFGKSGPNPLHPALLDWLAAEFMEPSFPGSAGNKPWSMKHLHRLMVTSAAYRMASTPEDDNLKIDPDNQYYWRMPSRRLEAEVVRDSLFYIAGKLDLTMGGPELDHTQGLAIPRRSLYFRHADDKRVEFLKIFDGASPLECYQRTESIVPQQALAIMNSDLARNTARLVAQALAGKQGTDPAAFARAAFTRVLGRLPTDQELTLCATFLAGANPDRARENLVHALLNHYEFRTAR